MKDQDYTDIKSAFLHGDHGKKVYMGFSPRFVVKGESSKDGLILYKRKYALINDTRMINAKTMETSMDRNVKLVPDQ